jgi:hypothetical protein
MGTNDEAGFSGFLWVERAPIGWSVDRALCDGVMLGRLEEGAAT